MAFIVQALTLGMSTLHARPVIWSQPLLQHIMPQHVEAHESPPHTDPWLAMDSDKIALNKLETLPRGAV